MPLNEIDVTELGEEEIEEKECRSCNKIFGYQMKISYDYDSFKINCERNGLQHEWKRFGEEYLVLKDKRICWECDTVIDAQEIK